jgi:hypothetical protein
MIGGWVMDIAPEYPFMLCTALSVVVLIFMVPLLHRSKKQTAE